VSWLAIAGEAVISLSWNAVHSTGASPSWYTLHPDVSPPQRAADESARQLGGAYRHCLARLIR
jgi:hypothetical protein